MKIKSIGSWCPYCNKSISEFQSELYRERKTIECPHCAGKVKGVRLRGHGWFDVKADRDVKTFSDLFEMRTISKFIKKGER